MRKGLPLYCLAALVALVACRSAAQNTAACNPGPANPPLKQFAVTVAKVANGYAPDTQPDPGEIDWQKKDGASWLVAGPVDIEGVEIEFARKDITTVTCKSLSSKVWSCTSTAFCQSNKPDKHEKYSVTVIIDKKRYVEDPEMVIYP